jgi:two-component sensor histidine kinase
MALHELSTNAAKHGALSTPAGRIEFTWRLLRDASGSTLEAPWREFDGPPVSPPAERGFGLTLLERGVAYELGGRARLDFRPDGVVWERRAPLGFAEDGPPDRGLDEDGIRPSPRPA